jgi:1-acyl-sn-glycerol-3-phosphate acyltransferase
LLYTVFRPLARIALGWYYRSVEVVGLERIPSSGPVFLAGNHPNALMDALVIGVLVPRPVRLLAKSTLFKNPVVGALLHGAGVIPLHRAKDVAQTEVGGVDPSRNAASFRAVADALAEGDAVVIFPEGISHDEPQLAPLRTGLARMAIEARDMHGVRDITIVPVGLVFEAKEAPRSRVLLQVGDAINVDTLSESESAVGALTGAIEQRLRAVTLNFRSNEDATRMMSLAQSLFALFTPVTRIGAEADSLADVVQLVQRINRATSRITGEFTVLQSVEPASEPSPLAGSYTPRSTAAYRIGSRDVALTTRMQAFEKRLSALNAQLSRAELAIEDIQIDPGSAAGTRFAWREGALALIRGPIGLWGRVNHWLPITLTRAMALRGVKSLDQPAMRSVVFGLVLVLGFYAAQTGLVAWLAGGWWALAYALSLAPSASSDFRFGDRTRRARERMRAYFTFRRNAKLQRTLRAEAEWLRDEALALERALHEGEAVPR